MALVKCYRYTMATTKKQVMDEINNPNSRDYGTSQIFPGLCVSLAEGQEDFRPAKMPLYKLDNRAVNTPLALIATFNTDGCAKRNMWSFWVDELDVLEFCGRIVGSYHKEYLADGVIIRPGAKVYDLKRVTQKEINAIGYWYKNK